MTKEVKEHIKTSRSVVVDHPDAQTDWGHGITAEILDKHFKNKLTGCGSLFVQYANVYKINPGFMACIATTESGNGKSDAAVKKNNFFGIMDPDTGWMTTKSFDSVQEGIRWGFSNMARNYMSKGRNTLDSIQALYCPIGAANDPNNMNAGWKPLIQKLYKQIIGKEIGSGPGFFGVGVSVDPLTAVENGYNGTGAVVGDGTGLTGGSDIDFDNREDWENLTEINGVILSFLSPEHRYSVKNHKKAWEEDKYTREFHYGVDSTGIVALKETNLIAQSMQDNNKSTYINRALFENKAIKKCLSIGIFASYGLVDYTITEKKLIRGIARVLHKFNLETKDLWREFDLNRAPSPIQYLDRTKWKMFLTEVDKQLMYLQQNHPQLTGDELYQSHVGSYGIITSTCNLREEPSQDGNVIKQLNMNEKYEIVGYSNTWYELKLLTEDTDTLDVEGDTPEDDETGASGQDNTGWVEVKNIKIEKDFIQTRTPEDEESGDEISLDFPEVDESKMPEITNIFNHEEFEKLLEFSSPMYVDNYADLHEPYDKNLPGIINATITDDDRMANMTTTIESLEENKMYFSIIEASAGQGDHCKRAPAELNGIWKSEHLNVEPIYPDLIIPPKYTTADQNMRDPNSLPAGIFGENTSIKDYLSEDKIVENNGMYKISLFDYNMPKKEKETKGKPVNYADPYPYDDKINELESHHPKVKIDEIESRLYDCNHIGCPIGQPMAKNFHMLNNAMIAQSKKTEKRLVKLENTLAFVMRNLGRLGSRMHINCVYYGGQDTFGKYKTIRCLRDDRLEDGCSMTIDQCMSCTRYEPILGQIYEILDETGMNGAFITDDEQMSYGNAIDFNKLDYAVNKDNYANLTDNSSNDEYKSMIDLWKDIDREAFEADLKEKYSGEELEKKLKAVEEHEYLFKMDWEESLLENQEPDVKVYPTEGIKAKYKVKPVGDPGEDVEVDDKESSDKARITTQSSSVSRTVNKTGSTMIANAVFTAYYPTTDPNDTLNWDGDPYTANGTLLDPANKNTCAAPKEIPFGTKIRVSGTGTDRDGLIYEVTDRGGAIKYNSSTKTYRIDLCLMTKADCYAFGKRSGQIEIGVDGSTVASGGSGGISTMPGSTNTPGTVILGTSGGNVTVAPITGVGTLGAPTDANQTGDNDVKFDKENYDKISEGEWVDTRETADTHELNTYSSEEFYFEGFGTNINSTVDGTSFGNVLGVNSTETRKKICEMALKIVSDHVDRNKAGYSQSNRTLKYVADQPGNEDKFYYYDCSSFVSCCYHHAGLTDFTNGSTSTILSHAKKPGALMWKADAEGQKKALPGDVILIGKGEGTSFKPSHVVVWLGEDEWAHSSSAKVSHPNQIKHVTGKSLADYRKDEVKYFCRSAELAKKDVEEASQDGTGQFGWPVKESKRLTSRFGPRNISNGSKNHKGIDIGAKPAGTSGQTILASDSGTVTFRGWSGGYGNLIKIDHGNGYETRYAHLASFKVEKNQKVVKGQEIGVMGATGGNYGIHLHFEIRQQGNALDPEKFLTHIKYEDCV